MVRLIVGDKGKGKTKELLDIANSKVRSASGNIVYLDKNAKHMYELNNRVRLIDVSSFMVDNTDVFFGFVNGILSQDHDLEQMYFDSFLTIACIKQASEVLPVVEKLEKLGDAFGVEFILSISLDADQLDPSLQEKIVLSL